MISGIIGPNCALGEARYDRRMASEISHEIQNRISGGAWTQYLDAELAAHDLSAVPQEIKTDYTASQSAGGSEAVLQNALLQLSG
jgi:hypothetical protein